MCTIDIFLGDVTFIIHNKMIEHLKNKNESKYEKLKLKIQEILICDSLDYVNDMTIKNKLATRGNLLEELIA